MNARHRLVPVLAGTVLAALLTAGTAWAAPADPPQLSIAVENDRTAIEPGDVLDYTVTIRNLGTSGVTGLRVSQSVPAGLKFESAGSSGRFAAGVISWKVDVKASGEATMRSRLSVVETPPDAVRVATVACARVAEDDPPLVCASHSAKVPTSDVTKASAPATDEPLDSWQLAVGAGLLASVVALVALLMVHRRRRSRARHAE